MRRRTAFLLILAAVGSSPAGFAGERSLLVVRTKSSGRSVPFGADAVTYGEAGWTRFTEVLKTAFDGRVEVVASAENLDLMLRFSSLLVCERGADRTGARLTSTEISNIKTWIQTGRRALLFGENDHWSGWDADILGIVGGRFSGIETGNASIRGRRWINGVAVSSPALKHPLTRDVDALEWTADGIALGGTPVFAVNVATLWGKTRNVLTVLSLNVVDDEHWFHQSNGQFAVNVASWLAADEAVSQAQHKK